MYTSLPDATAFDTISRSSPSPATYQKKRPHHSSPVPSYRGITVERSGKAKRARWDITSPMPSPPILSVPLPTSSSGSQKPFAFATTASQFQFGLQTSVSKPRQFAFEAVQRQSQSQPLSSNRPGTYTSPRRTAGMVFGGPSASTPHGMMGEFDEDRLSSPTAECSIRSAMAFDRLRRSTCDEGEVFVERMREWEQSQSAAGATRRVIVGGGRGGTADGEGRLHVEGIGSSSASISSPSMSNSITSNSSSMSSVSGSEAGSTTGRKRSWSIVEDDDDEDDDTGFVGMGTADMEWEVIPPTCTLITPGAGAISIFAKSPVPVATNSALADVEVMTEDQDGDDEQDDNGDEDSDDELVFVINNPPVKDKVVADGNVPRQPMFTTSVGTERMLEELSQVLAAGAGSLDDFAAKAQDSTAVAVVDGGALWE
ncbi:hypothetical protein FRB95_009416 [Tulasnella sp. JGI-2019a]|nr:hypothetical protein FRB93_012473 [Tulasnella sp. JGI-2019a]KAG9036268.1 hypothetical protein FRB95_009416 [Tulasnella sp. JGI-2019a]